VTWEFVPRDRSFVEPEGKAGNPSFLKTYVDSLPFAPVISTNGDATILA
jgi:hypothetical protein